MRRRDEETLLWGLAAAGAAVGLYWWWTRSEGAGTVAALLEADPVDPSSSPAVALTEGDRLDLLLPEVRDAFLAGRAELAREGIELLVRGTLRTKRAQAANIAKGTSATERSWHLIGRGIDWYPRRRGQAWDRDGKDIVLFKRVHAVLAKHGFTNIAFHPDGRKRYIKTSKGPVWDGGHSQWTGGMSWAAAAKDYTSRGKAIA